MKLDLLNGLRRVFLNTVMERSLVYFTVGRTFGTWMTKLPPNHYQYPKGSVRQVERNGFVYTLDLSDMVDWFIYYGFKEPARETLLGLITEGACFVDVGANVGQVTLHASRSVGPEGRVIAFEPTPFNLARLYTNLKLNATQNVTVEEMGLGDHAGTFLISNVDERNQGMNRILERGPDADHTSAIRVTTLDDYVNEHRLEHVDVIKIDVEGFEFKMLKGGATVIERDHPILFIELDDDNLQENGSTADELVQWLKGKGYAVVNASDRSELSEDLRHCHFDILCT